MNEKNNEMSLETWRDLPNSENPIAIKEITEKAKKGEIIVIDDDTGIKYRPNWDGNNFIMDSV
jgi:hypothetical protein